MTPQPELLRQASIEQRRSPVENAFMAFLALSFDDRQKMVSRFNGFHHDRPSPVSEITYTHDKTRAAE